MTTIKEIVERRTNGLWVYPECELPDADQEVLVATPSDGVQIGYLDGDDWRHQNGADIVCLMWRTVPEPDPYPEVTP